VLTKVLQRGRDPRLRVFPQPRVVLQRAHGGPKKLPKIIQEWRTVVIPCSHCKFAPQAPQVPQAKKIYISYFGFRIGLGLGSRSPHTGEIDDMTPCRKASL